MQKAGNRVQHGRFARTVRADERDDLALIDFKGNTLDGVNAAIVDVKIVHL